MNENTKFLNKPHILLMGPPGCGKGTASNLLIKEGFIQLSMGDILRAEIANNTPIGKRVQNIVASGQLIDDDTASLCFVKHLQTANNERYIFDGFPRKLSQTLLFDNLIPDSKKLVVHLDVEQDVILDRLLNRLTCSCGHSHNAKFGTTCPRCQLEMFKRPDDNAKVILNRVQVFYDETLPVIEYYKKKGVDVLTLTSDDSDFKHKQIMSKV